VHTRHSNIPVHRDIVTANTKRCASGVCHEPRSYLAPKARKSVFLEAGVALVGLHGMPSFMHVHNNGMMR
jgi:hypothetical protein